jgi:hypothetical protein
VCNVVITHLDGSTTVYPNCMSGVSNNQGNGWKLSITPTDQSQPPFVVDLRSGETYQTVGTLPTAAAFAATAPVQAPTQPVSAVVTTPIPTDVALAADATLIADALPPATTDTVAVPVGVPDPTL